MKKRTLLLTLALLPCFSFLNSSVLPPDPEIGEPIHIKGENVLHPRSVEDIDCYYLDGCVYIICDTSITSVSGIVTRLSDNMQWSDSNNGNMLQIAVSTAVGTYHLSFTLSDGSLYYGDYNL